MRRFVRLLDLLRSRGAPALRLAIYVATVGTVLGAIGARAAKAEAGQGALSIGRRLLPLLELESERSEITLNGQRLFVSSALVDEPVEGALDRFAEACGPSERGRLAPRLDFLRREADGEGIVLCFVRPEGRSLGDALQAFGESKDLSSLGDLRYAYAKTARGEPGERPKTRVVATWTEGSFRPLARLESGDAAGSDPEAAPRPPEATRELSASLGSQPYGIYAYASKASPDRILRFYDEALNRDAWVAIRPPGGEASGRAYVKDGVQILVSAITARGGGSEVSVGELGATSRPAPPAPSERADASRASRASRK